MSLRDQYSGHLSEFGAAATNGLESVLSEGSYGHLRRLGFDETEEGVFVTFEIALAGEVVQRWGSEVYSRRYLIIRRQGGPIDPADFGAALVQTSVMEDLDTAGRRQAD